MFIYVHYHLKTGTKKTTVSFCLNSGKKKGLLRIYVVIRLVIGHQRIYSPVPYLLTKRTFMLLKR